MPTVVIMSAYEQPATEFELWVPPFIAKGWDVIHMGPIAQGDPPLRKADIQATLESDQVIDALITQGHGTPYTWKVSLDTDSLTEVVSARDMQTWCRNRPPFKHVFLRHSTGAEDMTLYEPGGRVNWVTAYSRGDPITIIAFTYYTSESRKVANAGQYRLQDILVQNPDMTIYEAWQQVLEEEPLLLGYPGGGGGYYTVAPYGGPYVAFVGDSSMRIQSASPPQQDDQDNYYYFPASSMRVAHVNFIVNPSGKSGDIELWLSRDGVTKEVTSGLIPFYSTGVEQQLNFTFTMPPEVGQYGAYVDVYMGGVFQQKFETGVIVIPTIDDAGITF